MLSKKRLRQLKDYIYDNEEVMQISDWFVLNRIPYDEEDIPEELFKELDAICLNRIINGGLSGDIKSQVVTLLLKSRYNFIEKSAADVDQQNNQLEFQLNEL